MYNDDMFALLSKLIILAVVVLASYHQLTHCALSFPVYHKYLHIPAKVNNFHSLPSTTTFTRYVLVSNISVFYMHLCATSIFYWLYFCYFFIFS